MGIRRGFVFLTVGQGVSMIAAYATHAILARILGPGDYGRYGVFLSVVSTVALILTAGLPEAIAKFAAEHAARAKEIFAAGIRLQLRFSVLVALAYAACSPLIARLLRDERLTWELLVTAASIPPIALYAIVIGAFSGERRFGLQAITVAAYGALRCLLSVALTPFYSAWGAIVALVVAPTLVVAVALPAVFQRGSQATVDGAMLRRFAAPVIVFTVLLALLMNIDLLIVKTLATAPEQVGYYTAAATIAKLPYFGFSSLGVVLLPTLSAAAGGDNGAFDAARRSIRWTALAAFAASAAVAAIAPSLLRFLYGEAYAGVAIPLALLVVSGTFFTLFFIVAYALNGLGQPRIAMRLAGIGLLFELGLSILLGKLWGAAGVALASCVTAAVTLSLLSWAAKPYLGSVLGGATLARAGIALIVTIATGWLLPDYGALGVLVGAPLLLVNLGVLVALRETNLTELLGPLRRLRGAGS